MKSKKKLVRLIIAAFVILFMMPVITAPKTQAASLLTKNRKAQKVLKKKYNDLYNNSAGVTHIYMDMTGDMIPEMLADCNASSTDGMYTFYLYQAKGSKAKCILKADSYGLAKVAYYKKSKSIILTQYGHGGETYSYYKFKGGKYKCIASRSRISIKGGSAENGPWLYYAGASSSKAITKAAFDKKTKGMKKGKAKATSPDKWIYTQNPAYTW